MEMKVVLTIKNDYALYLFNNNDKIEYVVAIPDGQVAIGDIVESWSHGHYFKTLEEAVDYLKQINFLSEKKLY